MRKRLLRPGLKVAVFPGHPVPIDPAARIYRDAVRLAEVFECDHATRGVNVLYDGDDRVVNIGSRQIIATWEKWQSDLDYRDKAANSQAVRLLERSQRDARALEEARAIWPTARMRDHVVMIDAEDFLAGLPDE